MAFTLPLNPPEMNPRLKIRPALAPWAVQFQQHTEATLWKEAGNARLQLPKAAASEPQPAH